MSDRSLSPPIAILSLSDRSLSLPITVLAPSDPSLSLSIAIPSLPDRSLSLWIAILSLSDRSLSLWIATLSLSDRFASLSIAIVAPTDWSFWHSWDLLTHGVGARSAIQVVIEETGSLESHSTAIVSAIAILVSLATALDTPTSRVRASWGANDEGTTAIAAHPDRLVSPTDGLVPSPVDSRSERTGRQSKRARPASASASFDPLSVPAS